MVSKFATGYSTDAEGRPFERRSYRPAIVIVTVLAVIAAGAWIYALVGDSEESFPTDCAMPSAGSGADLQNFKKADRDAVLAASPAALSSFRVQVLNSAAPRGEARTVSDDLTAQGFAPAEPAYGDDTVYPNRDLDCVGQVRFGKAGQNAAAAVWLAAPCAQLIDDGRTGSDVDLVLGEYFTDAKQTQDVQAALEALRSVDPKNPKSAVDRSLIETVHKQSC
ncbi:MAG: envelope integrity protein Cei [Gordonia sp. (in: high G+C Gram-positive bacteria)]